MKILALDPSTKTGWAHSNGQAGVWMLNGGRDESKGVRLVRLKRLLTLAELEHGVDFVVFEAARIAGGGGAFAVLAEIQGVIKLWCEENKIPYKGYSSTAIKKHATGKGNAKKNQMVDAACRKWNRAFADHQNDEVDALWLLDLAKFELATGRL